MLSLQRTWLVKQVREGLSLFLHFSLNRVAASVTKALYMYTICLNVRKRGVCWGGGRIKKMSTDRLFSGRVSPV